MTRQAAFADALLHPAAGCPPGLRAHNGSDPQVRFNVHRNNVVTSLVSALADGFPVTRQLVGEAFFNAMAQCYVVAQPPVSPLLGEHADGFAAFIAAFAPAAGLPYRADVARLERARVRAFHAADAEPLAPDAIAARLADPAALARAGVELHPSVELLQSDHAVVSLWAAHQGHGAIEQVNPFVPEAALVLREDDDAVVLRVPLAAARFLRRLAEGASLADAAAAGAGHAAAAPDAPFDLAASLALLIGHRAIIAWRHPLEPAP
jgi:hypothetical protein